MSGLNITIPGLFIIVGQQGSGKSQLIKYVLRQYRSKFSYGICYSNTAFDGGFEYIPSKFVYSEYDETSLVKLMNLQAGLVQQGITKEAFVVFDDVIDVKTFNSPALRRLTTQLRHYRITCILSTQYPNALPPIFRSNSMNVALFRTDSRIALKALWEAYGQKYTEREFKDYLLSQTKDYAFLFVDKKKDTWETMKCPETIKPFKLRFNTKIQG
jgi:Cdc6-like AAA superfamily ATPase